MIMSFQASVPDLDHILLYAYTGNSPRLIAKFIYRASIAHVALQVVRKHLFESTRVHAILDEYIGRP